MKAKLIRLTSSNPLSARFNSITGECEALPEKNGFVKMVGDDEKGKHRSIATSKVTSIIEVTSLDGEEGDNKEYDKAVLFETFYSTYSLLYCIKKAEEIAKA